MYADCTEMYRKSFRTYLGTFRHDGVTAITVTLSAQGDSLENKARDCRVRRSLPSASQGDSLENNDPISGRCYTAEHIVILSRKPFCLEQYNPH
jgi:hypothetical protein